MTLNSSGPISLGGSTAGQSVNLELGFAATATIAMNTTAVRTLAGFPTAGTQYSMSNFYGKSNRVAISSTFTTNTSNASLNLSAISGYSAGKSDITVTVNNGIYLWASTTGNYGLTLTGATTGDTLTVVNSGGKIMGCGGDNGANNGGPAMNVAGIGITSLTINNTNASAYIGGGGGGGGNDTQGWGSTGGGGAGGGNSGGTGGTIGNTGGNGSSAYQGGCLFAGGSGGGGGRIFPGSGGAGGTNGFTCGTPTAGGGSGGGSGGGGGGNEANNLGIDQPGGAGGSANAVGGNGASGGGGGWGASGGTGQTPGSGGKAVNTGGKSVTWTSGNTTRVYGAVS
jgi:hypothetical protein